MLDEINQSMEFDYYNYNIQDHFDYSLFEDDSVKHGRVFGVSHTQFLKMNQYELVAGRFLSQDEIDEGKNGVVVSDEMKIMDHGIERNVEIGDTLILKDEHDEKLQIEVIGIYQSTYQDYYLSQGKDAFINSNGMLVSNKLLYQYLNKKDDFDYDKTTLNWKIWWVPSDDLAYSSYQKLIDEKIKDYAAFVLSDESLPYHIEYTDRGTLSILESISKAKTMYQLILLCAVFILSLLFFSVIYYILSKKIKEIEIYVSLGQSKKNIFLHYLLICLIIGVFASLCGMIVGYEVSLSLNQNLFRQNAELYNELVTLSDSLKWNQMISSSLSLNYQFHIWNAIWIFLEIVVILVLSVWLAIRRIFHRVVFKK